MDNIFANYGYHPKFDVPNILRTNYPTVEDLASQLLKVQKTMRLQLEDAQDRYKIYVDVLRKESPSFQISEKVWLL